MPFTAGQKVRASELNLQAEPPRARLLPGAAGTGGNAGGGAGAGNLFPTVTYKAIRWGAAPILSGMTWTTANPTRLICTVAGEYWISGSAAFSQAAGGRLAVLAKNGVQVESTATTISAYAGFFAMVPIPATLLRLAVNDYIELLGYQDSGSQLEAPGAAAGGQQASFQALYASL